MKIAFTFLALHFVAVAPLFAGGGHQHGPNGEHLGGGFVEGQATGPIELSNQAIQNLGIETFTVQEISTAPTSALFGKVVPHPKRVTSVSASFSGRVEKIFVIEGDHVARNEELARVLPLQAGGKPVTLTAPNAGYITKVSTGRGETFSRGVNLVEVSDLSKMLFRGELFDSKLVEKVQIGVSCSVVLTALSSRTMPCKIESIDSVFRGTPPVLYIYSSLPNDDGALKPNMSGKLHVEVGTRGQRLLVPQNAVLGEFNDRFVFVRKSNMFSRSPVTLGIERDNKVEITDGVKAGDKIVTQGQYQLQFAKSSAGAESSSGHSHDHGDHSHASGEEHDHPPAAHDHPHPHPHAKKKGSHEHDHDHDHDHDHAGDHAH